MSSMTVLAPAPLVADELTSDLRAACRGTVTGPQDAGYDTARAAWNLAVDQRPAAVVEAADAADVAAVMTVAARHGRQVAPQSTGHNAGALGGAQDVVLLKTSELKGVVVEPEARTVRVGAGVVWAEVVAATAPYGLAPLAGSAGDVGVVGYLLGGGLSFLGRRHGLASGSVRAMDVVLPDGRTVRAEAGDDGALLWALRGGGACGAVVTAVELDLFEVSEISAGQLFFPLERAPEILRAWRNWTQTAPEAITTSARMMRFPPLPEVPEPLRGGAFVIIDGAYVGPHAECVEVLAPLASRAPLMDTWAPAGVEALCQLHLDPPHPVPGIMRHALLDCLDDATLEALIETVGADSGTSTAIVELRQLGGAMARGAAGGGARTAIKEAAFAFLAIAIPAGPVPLPVIHADLDAALRCVEPRHAGALSSFTEEPGRGSCLATEIRARLETVRAALDPAALVRGAGDAV